MFVILRVTIMTYSLGIVVSIFFLDDIDDITDVDIEYVNNNNNVNDGNILIWGK